LITGGAPHSGSLTPTQVCALSTTTKLSGTPVAVTVPVSISGDLCISGNPNPAIGNPASGAKISAYVGGGLYETGGVNNAIGTSTSTVASARIVGGCFAPATVACDASGSGVWADDYNTSLTPPPSKPLLNASVEAGYYSSASPGPTNPCTTGSTGSTFRFDSAGSTVPDTSLGTKDLLTFLGNSPWDCVTASGELKWTPGGPGGLGGTLYVAGQTFIDASLTLSGNESILWAGRGSIYVNGTVVLSGGVNGARLCGVWDPVAGKCDFANWTPSTDPSQPLVFLSAYNGGSLTTVGFDLQGQSNFQGIAYTNGGFQVAGGAETGGTALADYANIQGTPAFQVTNNPPPGSNGGTSPMTVRWAVAPQTWHECPASVGCT
jgi:hypothetical protein